MEIDVNVIRKASDLTHVETDTFSTAGAALSGTSLSQDNYSLSLEEMKRNIDAVMLELPIWRFTTNF